MRFSIRIIDLKLLDNIDLPVIRCWHMDIYVRNNSSLVFYISTVFSLLDSNEGFLFRCKSTILQQSHAVSGFKDVPKQFWQKQEVFLTYNLLGVEGKAACSFIEPSTDLIPLHASDKKEWSFITSNWQK